MTRIWRKYYLKWFWKVWKGEQDKMSTNDNRGGFNLGDRLRRGFEAITIKDANKPDQVNAYENRYPNETQNYGGGILGRIRAGIGAALGPGKPRK
jgi:hypothetical protein